MTAKNELGYTVLRVENTSYLDKTGIVVQGKRLWFEIAGVEGEFLVNVSGKSISEAQVAIENEVLLIREMLNLRG